MKKITGLSHLFKWENLHNWWLTKYFFAPLYMTYIYIFIYTFKLFFTHLCVCICAYIHISNRKITMLLMFFVHYLPNVNRSPHTRSQNDKQFIAA